MKKPLLFFSLLLWSVSCLAGNNNSSLAGNNKEIDLSGRWQFSTTGTTFGPFVSLPGTTDTNGLGKAPQRTDETTHLTRLHLFIGKAWYRRTFTVDKDWKGKKVFLHLERTKPSTVWIDGDSIGSSNDISTPQVYNIGKLKPGVHTLTIRVDNGGGVPPQVMSSSHAYSPDTQTNWNGILGRIFLSLQPDIYPTAKIQSTKDCFRNFEIRGQHFYANGHMTFLRGKHDAGVWPLTGHVPMDVKSWLWYFGICKDWGINHIRFHSWCPPEAAFVAADSLGLYLQPELPIWGSIDSKNKALIAFLHKEGINILKTYGRHPSFVMMSLGNELWGSIETMRSLVADFRKIAPDKFYTFGSNGFLGYRGVARGMQYFTTCRVGGERWGRYNTHTRGSFSFADAFDGGVINHIYPSTNRDFHDACLLAKDSVGSGPVPVISHETGQFQVYPDYNEIAQYTGVLYPYNFEVFRHRLALAGMADEAEAFHRASGRWAAQLYKADIELDLRTDNMAGFQLLDLQDYPGQGTALVGMLNAFMQNKGCICREDWRKFCSPVVPLAVLSRYTYESGETIPLTVKVANYGGTSLKGAKVKATLINTDGSIFSEGQTLTIADDSEGLLSLGKDNMCLPSVKKAVEATLTLTVEAPNGAKAVNDWPIWVYPTKDNVDVENSGIIETTVLSEDIAKKLQAGAKVLWAPDSAALSAISKNTVGGLFITDYWNWRMFKTICEKNHKDVSPGTLGILTDAHHPIFNSFPTDDWTSWQWFPIMKNSRPLILDRFPAGYKPIVQVIDNVERNHKLGLVMEFAIGKGRLLLCMSDMKRIVQYPEGRAFRNSLLRYMMSNSFQPECKLSLDELKADITATTTEAAIKRLDNISQY
jgi:hypothetical protein